MYYKIWDETIDVRKPYLSIVGYYMIISIIIQTFKIPLD